MKVAVIEPVGGHGGMDYYDYGLIKGISKAGCKVLYCTCSQTDIRKYSNVTIKYTFGGIWKKNRAIKGLYFIFGYLYSYIYAKRMGCSVIHLHFFDIRLFNRIILLLARRLFGFKIVVTIHDVESFKNPINKTNIDNTLALIDDIIVHNDFSKEELIQKGANFNKVNVIPHGNYLPFVDELEFFPTDKTELNLLFFGQIKEVKGLEVLLVAMSHAINEINNIHLTIAGRPWHDNIEKYEELVDEYALTPFVTSRYEFIPDDEVASYFCKSDLVVLPYKKIYQSGVLLLAMSYGRPVIASDLAAFKEIITDNKTGFLFESENELDLAKKICSIAKDKAQLVSIRNNASKILRREFDWDKIGRLVKEIYS